VRQQIAALEKRVPKLTIKLALGAPEGTRVKRDDIELGAGSMGTPLPANPGKHVLLVSAPGHIGQRYEVVLQEGMTREILVEPGVAEGGPAAAPLAAVESNGLAASKPPTTGKPPSSARQTFGWIALGVGVVGVASVVGHGFWLEAKKEECKSNSDSCEAAKDRLPFYYGSWAVAGVGLGVGTYLLLSAPDETVVVRAQVTPERADISAVGRFW
jgi:hypothetical protein